EIVSWILMAAVLGALDRALATEVATVRRRILWGLLPALQILWVNIQSLFILGPAFMALALIAALVGLLRRPAPAGAPERAVDILVGLAAGAVASLANPYGAAAIRLPFEQLFSHLGGRSLLSQTIVEFQPTLLARPVTPSIIAFEAFVLLAALVFLVNLPRVRAWDLLVAAATLYLALKARRNIPLFVIAATPILLRQGAATAAAWRVVRRAGWPFHLTWGALRDPAAGRTGRMAAVTAPALVAVLGLGLTADVVSNRFFLRVPTERWWGVGEIPDYFPEEAADFVESSRAPGETFHPLWAGGFLIDAWEGDRRVFIDGRNDPYVGGVLETYLKTIGDPAVFEDTARRYQITMVLWPHQRALEGRALLAHLAHGRGWTLVHLDPAAAVYMRSDLAPTGLPAGGHPESGPSRGEVYADLARRLDEAPFHGPPLREIALGEFFSVTGDPPGAVFFFRRALDRLPRSAPLLHDYALALERQGRREEARRAHEAAVEADPGFLPSLEALGTLLMQEGRIDEARRRLDAAYGAGDRSVAVMTGRGRLFEQEGRLAEAVAAYKDALLSAPRSAVLLREVALFHVRHHEAEAALPYYARAAEADPDDPATAREMAELLEGLGRLSAALDVARDAAHRAVGRLEEGSSEGGGEEDRRLIRVAARLEARAGNPQRESDWLAALEHAGPPRGSSPER
ncbi:MAG TPA: hypothetical protein VFT43_08320, partial [Candidatus Polarisedimenticolia bacterium]|nr:hypothetical protein [Candidatus Polarisedimenticolia bacterium]